MTSLREADAGMLAAVGLTSASNDRMAQTYNEDEAVVATYETTGKVEFLFIPYENEPEKVGVFPFYKGEYIPFQAYLQKVGDDDIRVVTEAGVATYTREGQILQNISFTRAVDIMTADVMTADEIKEMRMQRRTDTGVDDAISYYLQCMDDVITAGAWFCDGCATGKLTFSIGCGAFEPCVWGANITCIGLAILNRFR